MSFTLVKELEINPVFERTLRPLTDAESKNLREQVLRDGFLSPILFHVNNRGLKVVVDGHNRYRLWAEIESADEVYELSEPQTEEVASLRGASDEVVVNWIIQHQAARRNDESLATRYAIGKEYNESGRTSIEVANEHGIDDSTVRNWGRFADAIDDAEEIEPGVKDEVLKNEPVTYSKVMENVAEPEKIVDIVTAPTPPKDWDLGAAFKKLSTLLGGAARTTGDIASHTGLGPYPEQMEKVLQQANLILDQWQASEFDT